LNQDSYMLQRKTLTKLVDACSLWYQS